MALEGCSVNNLMKERDLELGDTTISWVVSKESHAIRVALRKSMKRVKKDSLFWVRVPPTLS